MKKNLLIFFLFMQGALLAQYRFEKIDRLMQDHIAAMGGRAILVRYQDAKIVYTHAENEPTPRQKLAGRFIARRQGKQANTADYTTTTQPPEGFES